MSDRLLVKEIDLYRCVRCGVCDKTCPNDVIRMQRGRPVIVYQDDCSQCFACVLDCPRDAIHLALVTI